MKNERLQWFLDRIGKRVFRSKLPNCCTICTNVYQEGLIIFDQMHAEVLQDYEVVYAMEGIPLKYFDTKDEVISFEAAL